MENKKFWMVVSENRKDGYNNFPTKKHEREEDAEIEADRLCIKHPEVDFYLLESVKTYRGTVSVDSVNHFSDKEE